MPGRDREFTMRFLAGAENRNVYGNVHGGSMMKWMDEGAGVCAAGWSGLPCVTVAVSGITFHKPVAIGDIVEIRARLIHTGRTSMHIAVNVCSRDPRHGEYEEYHELPDGLRGLGCQRPSHARAQVGTHDARRSRLAGPRRAPQGTGPTHPGRAPHV